MFYALAEVQSKICLGPLKAKTFYHEKTMSASGGICLILRFTIDNVDIDVTINAYILILV